MRKILPFLLFTLPVLVIAQQNPVLLVKDLPFIGNTTDLTAFLQGIFRLTLGIAVTASIAVIVWNGIRYMTTDVVNSKGDALSWIKDALWGLVLAFSAVLILQTINPKLTEFEFLNTLQELRDTGGGGGGDEPPTPGGIPNEAQENAVRSQLEGFGVTFSRPCRVGEVTQDGCVTLYGLPGQALSGITALAIQCTNCSLRVTGGVEPGHKTHGVGRPMVDLSRGSQVTSFILENSTPVRNTCKGRLYSYGGSEFLDETGGIPHWHICFGTTCSFQPGC